MDNPNEKRKIRKAYLATNVYIYIYIHLHIHTYIRTYVHTYTYIRRCCEEKSSIHLRSGMRKGGKCSLFSDFRLSDQ